MNRPLLSLLVAGRRSRSARARRSAASTTPPTPPPDTSPIKTQEATPQQRAADPHRARRRLLRAGADGRGARGARRGEDARSRRIAKLYNIYGLVYAMLGENAKAEENFRQAIALAPNDSDIRANWGAYLCATGRAREAMPEFEQVLRDPLYRTPEIALINAGKCSVAIGETKRADEYLPPRADRVAGQPGRRVQPCAARVPRVARRRGARVDAAGDAAGGAAARSALSRHVHRAQAGRPRAPSARTNRSCATAGRIRPRPRRWPAERASDRRALHAAAGRERTRRSPPTAGARAARLAREAAGLSVDDVAQQLKLAPRQVQALEDDDYQRLPGRTFVRGFVRNYARFIQLDPDAVLALLPAADSDAGARTPDVHAGAAPDGRDPRRARRRSAPVRAALVPLLLLAIVGAAAYYEYSRAQPPAARREADAAAGGRAPAHDVRQLAAPSSGRRRLDDDGVAQSGMPNPRRRRRRRHGRGRAKRPAPRRRATDAPGGGCDAAPTAGAAPRGASERARSCSTFKGTSWAEVKDANGRVILQMTGGAGMTQTVSGAPPLELSSATRPTSP